MAGRIMQACGGHLRGKTIGILGVAFKPNTDDMRDAPSLSIVPALQDAGAVVRAYDPEAMHEAERLLPDVVWCDEPYAVAEGASAVALLTEWNEFRALDFERLGAAMAERVFVDLRNVYRPGMVRGMGFRYSSIGRS
jgi:UDPglucose 6-dehydrogenase